LPFWNAAVTGLDPRTRATAEAAVAPPKRRFMPQRKEKRVAKQTFAYLENDWKD
jgi:hypothetical protein